MLWEIIGWIVAALVVSYLLVNFLFALVLIEVGRSAMGAIEQAKEKDRE